MSFDNTPPFAQWQSSLASSDNKQRARSNRTPQSAREKHSSGSIRRGFAPLANSDTDSTAVGGLRGQRQESHSLPAPVPQSTLSLPPSSSTRLSSSKLGVSTAPIASGIASEHNQAGAPQIQAHPSRSDTSPGSRASTPSSHVPAPTTSGASLSGSGAGGGGGFSLAPRTGIYTLSATNRDQTSPTKQIPEKTSSISSIASSSTSQSSLSKISATQIALLLDTINEREGLAKWQSKADKIVNLLDSNGSEVFAQFFRRAVSLNQQAIFGDLKGFDQGSYKLLRERILSIQKDSIQAFYIAEAVDTAREDNFRRFDLTAFIRHFLLDPVSQAVLAVAFTTCARSDLRVEAENLLVDIGASCLHSLADPLSGSPELSASSLGCVLSYYGLTATLLPVDQKEELHEAILQKVSIIYNTIPESIMAASQMWRMPDSDRQIIDALRRLGPKGSSKSFDDIMSSVGQDSISEADVANAVLFILLGQPSNQYNISDFVTAVNKSTQINWNGVLRMFDVIGVRITNEAFAKLYNALLPIAIEDNQFDIQKLWGGTWHNMLSQLSFLRAFFLCPAKDIKLDRVPNLRPSLVISDFEGMAQDAQREIKTIFGGQYASQDALRAVLEVVLSSDQATEEDDGNAILQEIVRDHMEAFILSLCRLPRPVTQVQENFIERCFMMYLNKVKDTSDLVLEAVFRQSPEFTNFLCTLCFHNDPRRTEVIYQRAQEFDWMNTFLKAVATPLALDLACMRHKLRRDFDLDKYIHDAVNGLSPSERIQYGNTLWKYLRIKADDEYRVQREQNSPQSVPLSLKSVYTFLEKLQDLVSDREQLKNAQTTCLQTYPRLMNYGAGHDEVLERRSEERGNKLPEEIDRQMSELFGRMYRSEVSIRDMVSEMRKYKNSDEPELQDLFCCIVHGLFDEYICYSEYPEDALEKTALLFGNIIKYNLLPRIPQEYGLILIMDAVRGHEQDSAMHRFGVEALLQINERLPEWPGLCQSLLDIPSLQQPEIVQKAEEGVQQERSQKDGIGANGPIDKFLIANGSIDDASKDSGYRPFRSIQADPPSANASFRDPDEKSQEKILFVINNLSMDNMTGKLNDLKDVLRSEHHQWFAAYLVEQRARLEPNNQHMYFEFLSKLSDNSLLTEVVRETYVSVVKMINAKSTIDSAVERSHLKNLGGWLGSLTLAQDKPIKHHNLYFVDLLLEGFDTQRLVVVIPFTCKVLVQGARSTIFRSPNPWLMEVVGLLLELYHFAELKLNLKFEIEVLCKDLEIDHKKIEPAHIIRERPQQVEDDLTNTSGIPEPIEGFEDLSLSGPMTRGVRERISAQEIMASLPSLEQVLRIPPLPGTVAEQELVKNIINRAFDQAIQEIIAPVVERSITIASISTAQLVAKDYALVSDAEQYRSAARQMVKSLAGSLALVTCKEPLRMSITNYIRRLALDEVPEHLMSEGSILMCVNDNLDIACSFVEQAAEERAVPEIDHVIEQELEERRRFIVENPGRDYYSSNVSRWSTWIPEPYKQTAGGLNEAQRAVYEEFDRRVSGMNAGHLQNASTDSTGRQIPDVLQESLAMPVLSTPADQPAVPHQSPMNQPEPRTHSAMQRPRVNGFTDNMAPHERISVLLDEVQKHAGNSPSTRLKDVERDGVIFQNVRQILIILTSSTRPTADHIARQTAEKICHTFIMKPPQNILEAELLAFLLHKLCMLSELITRDVMRWTTASEEALLGNSFVTAALMAVGLMDSARIDGVIATALREHNEHGLHLLSELMDLTLFNEEPLSLRADFANSIVQMYIWLKEQPDLRLATEISSKLKAHGAPEYITIALSDKVKAKQDQMQYIFKEWVTLYENMSFDESTYATFLRSIHNDQVINTPEDLALFLRLCIDACIDRFDIEAQSYRGSVTAAFAHVDALALLLVLFLRFQGDNNGAVKKSKAKYLETLLSLIVLVLNHHVEMRGTTFNQRVFSRLLNSMLHEYVTSHLDQDDEHKSMMISFARTFQSLSPSAFPSFVYGWTNLIINRVFVEIMLRNGDDEMHEAYRTLLGDAFIFLGSIIGIAEYEVVYESLLRGTLRNVWIVRHDFPDFISENHAYFCARIHHAFPQVRNLILTARPQSFDQEPDPMGPGLKVDRLEQMKQSPVISVEIREPLEREEVLVTLQGLTRKSESISAAVNQVTEVLNKYEEEESSRSTTKTEFIEYLVTWIVMDATKNHEKFDSNSPRTQFLTRLITTASPQSRYFLALALADQLRFPSSHTEFALKMFLHLWSNTEAHDQPAVEESLLRVTCDLLIYSKPHPWGLVVAFQELTNNPAFGFWKDKGFGSEDLKSKLVATIRGH